MTIPATDRRSPTYLGADSTDTFAYDFHITADAELQVDKVNTTTNTRSTLILDTDYYVTGAGDPGGGDVILTAGNLATGYNLVISGNVTQSQETGLSNQGGWHPDVHEAAFDKLTKMVIEMQSQIDRCLKIDISDDVSTIVTFTPATGELQTLERKADGDFHLVDKYSSSWDAFSVTPPSGGYPTSYDPNTASLGETMDVLASVLNNLIGP